MQQSPLEMCQNYVPNNSIFFCTVGKKHPEVGGVSCEINLELQYILKEFICLVCLKSSVKWEVKSFSWIILVRTSELITFL